MKKRLIDANALMEYCNNQKDRTIDANDIARFPTAVSWISVKDAIPDEYADVLIVCHYRKNYFICIAWLNPDKIWSSHDADFYQELYEVKYWMPLPELPKR